MLVRLWLFTPRAGDYPEGGTYDTSVFDSVLKKCSDPYQFDKFENLMNYANGNGEVLQQVQSAAEAFTYCSPKQVSPPVPINTPPVTIPPLPPPVGQPRSTTDTPPPIIQPDTPGGTTYMAGTIYRLILESAPGRVDTGATYPLCSRSNTDACKPIQFASIDDAVNYANANGEIPVRVANEAEAWAIIEGSMPIQQSSVLGGGGFLESLGPIGIAALAVGAIVVLPKLMHKRG